MDYILLLLGFLLLIKGADAFVDGSSSVAKNFEDTDHYYRTYSGCFWNKYAGVFCQSDSSNEGKQRSGGK